MDSIRFLTTRITMKRDLVRAEKGVCVIECEDPVYFVETISGLSLKT